MAAQDIKPSTNQPTVPLSPTDVKGKLPPSPSPAPASGSVSPISPPAEKPKKDADSIEALLLDEGLINQKQLEDLKLEHINTGTSMEELIVARKIVDPADLSRAKAKVLGLEYVDVTELDIPSYILDFIPESIATKYSALPFSEQGSQLSVAMADPLDLQIIAIVEKKSGMSVKPFLAEPAELLHAIQQQYSKALGTEVTEAIKEVTARAGGSQPTPRVQDIDATDLKFGDLQNAPVARIVGNMLQYAVRSRASDVHIEPTEDNTRVRYRIDGVMVERLSLPRSVHDNLVARIKILSNLKIDEKRLPQDGRFKIQVGPTMVDLRVSTMPTLFGEKVVMRLLEGSGKVMPISKLGMRGEGLRRFESNLSKTVGMILITGPTGSGKTNTIASAVSRVNTPKVNIVTLEDPVEIRIPGVNQIQVNTSAGLTFSTGLRSILRQDPDIIMVGEIRDFETAELAIHAALTGHLVFSTLHTKSAAGALPRLYDMKVEPFLLASTVNLVVAQRLVRTLCNQCKQEYEPTDTEKNDIAQVLGKLLSVDVGALKLFKPAGCDECGGTGYIGRTGIFEVLQASPKIGRAVIERQPEGVLHKTAVEEGMVELIEDGYLKVIDGTTTLEEVLRVAND